VGGTGLRPCQISCFGISCIETHGSAIRECNVKSICKCELVAVCYC
jgi:hypothetical protein